MSLDRFLTQVVPVRQKLYRLAYRLVGNAEDAQDITQDTLMKVWDMQEKMAEVENMEAWCMRITRNLALDKIKYGKYRIAEGLDGIDIALPQKNPHVLAEEKDVLEKVNSAIQALPEKYRTLLQLRDIEGHTYQEIADIMESSINEVKVNLHRARKTVREKLQNLQDYGL